MERGVSKIGRMKKSLGILVVLGTTTLAVAQPAEPAPPTGGEAGVHVDLDRVIDDVVRRITGPEIEKLVRGTVRRARRAIALGPTVGAWVAHVPSPDVQEEAVTFGLGLEVFKIPVLPTLTNAKALLEERVRAKVRGIVVAQFRGVPPEPIELERLAREAFEEAKAELFDDANTRAKVWERPRFSLGLEGNRLLEAEAWMTRLRVGVGIWKLTLAGSFAVGFGDDTTVFTGVELGTHFLLSKRARSPVVDVFVRADFEVTDRDANTDHVTVGARFLLDLI